MNNMRILYDNAADRATVTASSTAGALVAANLLTDRKSEVWRATGSTASIYAVWPSGATMQAVALPFCNLSPTAMLRVRLTNELSTTNLLTSTSIGMAGTQANGDTSTDAFGIAPDGVKTSVLISAGTRYRAVSGLTVGAAYTYSEFVRAGTGTGAMLFKDGGGTNVTATYTFATGLFTAVAGGTAPAAKAVGAGWVRLSITFTATAATANFHYYPIGGSVEFWGAQLERGNVLTSYYPSGSAAATRPAGYNDAWQTYAYDSGVQPACPAPAVGLRGWTPAQAASAYAYGGGACARMWLPAAVQATGLAIDIADPNNLQGYVEAARLVAGPYWSPTYNASDASMTIVDTTSLYRTDAGDQGAEAGYSYRRVPVNLSAMPAADRTAFVNIVRNSTAYPILLSVYPESSDLALERDHMVYGRRSKGSDVALQYAASYSTTIEIEEI